MICSLVSLGLSFIIFFCAGSRVSAVSGHISQIRSIARICRGAIAIGIFPNALTTKLMSITNNSHPLAVILPIIVCLRF